MVLSTMNPCSSIKDEEIGIDLLFCWRRPGGIDFPDIWESCLKFCFKCVQGWFYHSIDYYILIFYIVNNGMEWSGYEGMGKDWTGS